MTTLAIALLVIGVITLGLAFGLATYLGVCVGAAIVRMIGRAARRGIVA